MGTLARAHGLKGEIRVDWRADSPLRSGAYQLQIGAAAACPVRVLAVRTHKGAPLVLLEGVQDRTAAEALRGGKLLVPEDSLPREEDDLFLYELPGFEIALHESGALIGRIDRVEFPAGREIWVVRTPEGRELLFPAVEEFVASVDEEARRISITPPPGLLDLYLG